jgi:hypothetical protein
MRKSLCTIPVLLLFAVLGASNAKADTVQVGTIAVTSGPCSDNTVCGSGTVTNDMSDTVLDILGFTAGGTSIPGPFYLAASSTTPYLNWWEGISSGTLNIFAPLGIASSRQAE